MSLHWYACISTNTYCFEMYYILLKTDWWALPNASSIVQICSAVHEILADKAFTATDVLISQSFVVAFVHPTYVRIVLIWGFLVQLSWWKSIHWLWRYKLNEVCDTYDSNWPTEPELWDNNFQPIPLHRSLEHLSSDASNLKKSIFYIAKYIQNKKIDMSKSNNIKNFEDIDKAA